MLALRVLCAARIDGAHLVMGEPILSLRRGETSNFNSSLIRNRPVQMCVPECRPEYFEVFSNCAVAQGFRAVIPAGDFPSVIDVVFDVRLRKIHPIDVSEVVLET